MKRMDAPSNAYGEGSKSAGFGVLQYSTCALSLRRREALRRGSDHTDGILWLGLLM